MSDSNPQSCGRANRLLLVPLLPGLLAALLLGAKRHGIESRNRAVELTLDYAELEGLSAASAVPLADLLRRFKSAGITGVAITEDTIGSLAETGQITLTSVPSQTGPRTHVNVAPSQSMAPVYDVIASRLAPEMLQPAQPLFVFLDGRRTQTGTSRFSFDLLAAPATLRAMGLGLPPDAVKLVKSARLDVVARLQNNAATTKRAIDASLNDLKKLGVRRVVFAGEEVLGFKGLVRYAAERIQRLGLIYGSVEFGKQKGDAAMSGALKSEFIRVHSIPVAELAGMNLPTAAERFVRAVRERGIRLCYIRLPETVGEDPVGDGLGFVASVRGQIEEGGYAVGAASPFEAMNRPVPFRVLMALSVVAGGLLLLGSLVTLSPAVLYSLLGIGLIGAAGLSVLGERGVQVLSLMSALVFPTLGVTAVAGPHFFRTGAARWPALKAVCVFAGISTVSLCGAVLVVGLLADRSYMVKVNQFSGIKVAHLLPILAVASFMAAGLPIRGKPWAQARAEMSTSLRKVMGHPLFVWHALAVVGTLIIIGFALLRTGNEPGVGVSGIELKLRAALDAILVVRPRTKEFLVGHPALFLGIVFLLTGRRAWGLPLVALGVLGQVSLLNTFCHIHTPLAVSALRAVNGLALGSSLGLVIWWIVTRAAAQTYNTIRILRFFEHRR